MKIPNVHRWLRALAIAALVAFLASPVLPARAQEAQQASATGAGGMPNLKLKLPELPSIAITAVPSYGVVPLTVGFFANGVDPKGEGFVSYLWNFGDGAVSMDPPMMFFHTYKNPGTYIVTLTATTADGRTASSYAGIIVRPPAN